MKKPTKILALLLALLLALCTFTACSKEEPENTDGKSTSETSQPEKPAEKAGTDETDVRMVLEGFGDTLTRGNIRGLADYVAPDTEQYTTYSNFDPSSLIPAESREALNISDEVAQDLSKQIFAKFSLTVKTINVDGDKATAVLASKAPDLENVGGDMDIEALLPQYIQEKGISLESLESSLTGKTDAEMQAWQDEFLAGFGAWALPQMLATATSIEKDINATLEKRNGEWYITQMDSLF